MKNKKKTIKRLFSLFLSATIMLSLSTLYLAAEETPPEETVTYDITCSSIEDEGDTPQIPTDEGDTPQSPTDEEFHEETFPLDDETIIEVEIPIQVPEETTTENILLLTMPTDAEELSGDSLPLNEEETSTVEIQEIIPKEQSPPIFQTLKNGRVTAEGMMPADAYLMVTEVELSDVSEYVRDNEKALFAYDIKIMLADGTEYQPQDNSPILITIMPDELDTSSVEVIHVYENSETGETTPETVLDVVTTEDGALEFSANSFSVYIITTNDSYNVNFDVESGYTVSYSDAMNGTFTLLEGDVSVPYNTTLYFKVTGTSPYVFRDGVQISADDGAFTVDAIIEDTQIKVSSMIDLDVSYGKIVIGETDGVGRIYTFFTSDGIQKSGTHISSNYYRIIGTTPIGTQDYNVTLKGDGDFNVVLDNASITTGSETDGVCAPVSTDNVTGTGNIYVFLIGDNYLENRSLNVACSYAALEKTSSYCTLQLGEFPGQTGSLTAVGGADSGGIGGSDFASDKGTTRNITINSGTINASTQASGGASIGSGNNLEAYGIRIYGGTITAVSAGNGAGIGGSGGVAGTGATGEVYIYGGTINAGSNGYGAGIGGGGTNVDGGRGYVYIYGGNITADSIGGGNSGGNGTGGIAKIEIMGGFVTITDSSGINGGDSVGNKGGLITVTIGGGTIYTPRISGGYSGSIAVYEGASLYISGGSINIGDRSNISSITNSYGSELYLTKIMIEEGAGTEITEIVLSDGTYGTNGIFADDSGYIYLWLPHDISVQSINGEINQTYIPTATITHSASTVGTVLTAILNHGTASAYKWERSSDSGVSWTEIIGATSMTYVTTSEDNGRLIRVTITEAGNEEYISASLNIVSPSFVVYIPEVIMTYSQTGYFRVQSVRSFFEENTVTVTLSTDDEEFSLKGGTQSIDYSLYTTMDRSAVITSGTTIATFVGNGSDYVPIYYTIADTPQYSGTYTDTLTFTVAYDNGS